MAVQFFFNSKKSAVSAETPSHDGHVIMNGTGSGTLLLIHGLTGTPNEMRYLANYFHRKKGYTVICPRLANHGAPLSVLKRSHWQDFYTSVIEAFTAVRSTIDGPIFAAGLSMGALLSLLLAEEFPGQIAGVSCLSPTLFYDGWNIPWYSKVLLPLVYATPLKHVVYFKEDPPYGIKNKTLQKRVHKYYAAADFNDLQGVAEYGYPYFPLTLLHQLYKLIAHLIGKLPAINVPVQLIQARDDDMTSIRNSTFIYDKIGSTLKELVFLDDCYHVITADQERAAVARNMDSFFSKIITGAEKVDDKDTHYDAIAADCLTAPV